MRVQSFSKHGKGEVQRRRKAGSTFSPVSQLQQFIWMPLQTTRQKVSSLYTGDSLQGEESLTPSTPTVEPISLELTPFSRKCSFRAHNNIIKSISGLSMITLAGASTQQQHLTWEANGKLSWNQLNIIFGEPSVRLLSPMKSSTHFSLKSKPCSIHDRSNLSVMTLKTSQRSHLLTSSLGNHFQRCLNLLWSTQQFHHQQSGASFNKRCNDSGLNGQLIIYNGNYQSQSGIIHPTTAKSAPWCSSLMSDFHRENGHLLGFSLCTQGRMDSPESWLSRLPPLRSLGQLRNRRFCLFQITPHHSSSVGTLRDGSHAYFTFYCPEYCQR